MMNQLFRLTFITFIWKKYKRVILSLLVLITCLWMVEHIHQDFIQYSQLNNDTSYLAASFIIKWMVFACAAILFIIANILFQSKKTSRQKPPASNTIKKSFIFRSTMDKKEPVTRLKDDPFDAIRHKPQLRSKADVMLERSQRERK